MPSLFTSNLGQRPVQIYMDVGVSLHHFKYPETLKKLYYKCNNIPHIFPHFSTMFSRKTYPFPYIKNKSKEFYCRFYIVKPFLYFSLFIFSHFSISFLYLLFCKQFLSFFSRLASFS